MLHTPVCELLGIEFPVIQAGMGLLTSAELVAAARMPGGWAPRGRAPVHRRPQAAISPDPRADPATVRGQSPAVHAERRRLCAHVRR